ncbi:PGRP1-like protein [Mya arenaria]|uniref:PGRP1-like protein n=1 Tax=Mya arenaria TaxID=6604 RepID=A0ABY7E4L1_MYAAR|nr:PGRP1-like protein [Mya arenaria]
MALPPELSHDSEFLNYVNVQVALSKVGESLEAYTEGKLRDVHSDVTRVLAPKSLPQCKNNCSEQLRKQFKSWCIACTSWKKELESPGNMRTPAGTQWDKMESWLWPKDFRNIAQVFIQTGWNTANVDLQDLTTVFGIWRRLARVPQTTVTDSDVLRDIRNSIAHATAQRVMRVDDSTKTQTFQEIRNVLSNRDVKPFVADFNAVMGMMASLENASKNDEDDDTNDELLGGVVRLVNRSGWRARPPKEIELLGTPVEVVLIHHSAVGENSTRWSDIAYNFVVGEDGRVYQGRSWDRVGAHTLGWNKVAISICFLGDYTDKLPPDCALEAAQELIKYGVSEGKLAPNYNLYGHCDARAGFESPGRALYALIKTWDHYDSVRPIVKPEPVHVNQP